MQSIFLRSRSSLYRIDHIVILFNYDNVMPNKLTYKTKATAVKLFTSADE